MTYASGCQPLAFIFKPIAVSVLRPDFCALGSAHYSVFAGHAQAALSAYLLSGCLDELRVYQLKDLFLLAFPDIGLYNQYGPAQNADLRGSKTPFAFISVSAISSRS